MWKYKQKGGIKSSLQGINYFRLLEYKLVYENLNLKQSHTLMDGGSDYLNLFTMYLTSKKKYVIHAIEKKKLSKEQKKTFVKDMKKFGIYEEYKGGKLIINNSDMSNLQHQNETFDRIYCISSIEHSEGKEHEMKIMKELFRVLKKKGRLVLTVPYSKQHKENINTYNLQEFNQRIYNYDSLTERIISPSGLKFKKAIHIGERFPIIGETYVKNKFVNEYLGWFFTLFWSLFWKVGYIHEKQFEKIDFDDSIYGVICIVLEK